MIKTKIKKLVIAGIALMIFSGIFSGVDANIQNNEQEKNTFVISEAVENFDFVEVAHAQSPNAVKEAKDDIVKNLVSVISIILHALNMLFWPLILIMGGLIDNSLIFGWGMEEKLLSIWQQIRNMVNVIFVVMLLGIALMNIIGVGGENYQLKSILPKFIIGLIAVNFSFLGMKVGLDALNVVTASVFSLPTTMEAHPVPSKEGETAKFFADSCKVVCGEKGEGCVNPVTKKRYTESEVTALKDKKELPVCYTPEGNCPQVIYNGGKPFEQVGDSCASQEMVSKFTHFNGNNAAMVLAIRMTKLAGLNSKDNIPEILEKENGWESLSMYIIFSLIMYIILGTGFVVMFIVLVTRLAVLWLAVALSPLIVLKYVFPQLLSQLGDVEGKIIKTAIAPVIIAFTMSIGFIMMDEFSAITGSDIGNLGGHNSLAKGAMSMDMGGMGISSIQQLFMAAATIAFVWMGIVGATSGTISESLTGVITGAVGKAGSWLAFAPFKYTGIIPVKGEKASLGTMMHALKSIPSSMESESAKQARDLFGIGATASSTAADINQAGSKEDIQKIISRPDFATHMSDPAVVKALKSATAQKHLEDAGYKNLAAAVREAGADGKFKEASHKADYEREARAAQSSAAASAPADTPSSDTSTDTSTDTPPDTSTVDGAKAAKKAAEKKIAELKKQGVVVDGDFKTKLEKAKTQEDIKKALDDPGWEEVKRQEKVLGSGLKGEIFEKIATGKSEVEMEDHLTKDTDAIKSIDKRKKELEELYGTDEKGQKKVKQKLEAELKIAIDDGTGSADAKVGRVLQRKYGVDLGVPPATDSDTDEETAE
jgi:hypothetical protein